MTSLERRCGESSVYLWKPAFALIVRATPLSFALSRWEAAVLLARGVVCAAASCSQAVLDVSFPSVVYSTDNLTGLAARSCRRYLVLTGSIMLRYRYGPVQNAGKSESK